MNFKVGDQVVVLPSERKAKLAKLVTFDGDIPSAGAGKAVTMVLEPDIDATRGDYIEKADNYTNPADRFSANLVWLGETELVSSRSYYLVNSSAEELSRNSINKVLQPIFDKLFNQGLKVEDSKRRVVIHTLRHTFASQLAIQGTPIYTIMKLMDHADISQTIRYAKLSPAPPVEISCTVSFKPPVYRTIGTVP